MKIVPRKFKLVAEIENVKIFISMFGGMFYHEDAYSSTHSHNSFEFHFVHEGESVIDVGSERIYLKRNDACVVSPNVIHTTIPKTDKHLKSTFCFSFEKTKRKTKTDMYEVFTSEFEKIDKIRKIENAENFLSELGILLTTFQSDGSFSEQRASLTFSLLMLNILEEISGKYEQRDEGLNISDSHTERNIRRIMIEDFVNEYYDTDISIKSLADALFLSVKQTERVFKKEMGMNFKAFVKKIRLESAMYYLSNSDMSVEDIAEKAGYKSYNGFYKLFLNEIGCTPNEFRKQCRKKALTEGEK
ncbi:MAG: AraC family transcriptional regulator [Clostridia bacterium]|nr:AraC family transcriptional regulator [Clostridia bacterium]MBQ4630478.1 AraC family transcriptional regulator [Clostridia bacterium]